MKYGYELGKIDTAKKNFQKLIESGEREAVSLFIITGIHFYRYPYGNIIKGEKR